MVFRSYEYAVNNKDGMFLRSSDSLVKNRISFGGLVPVMVDGNYYIADFKNINRDNPPSQIALRKVSHDQYVSMIDNESIMNLIEYAAIDSVSSDVNTLREVLNAKKESTVNGPDLIKRINYLDKLAEGKSKIDMKTGIEDPTLSHVKMLCTLN